MAVKPDLGKFGVHRYSTPVLGRISWSPSLKYSQPPPTVFPKQVPRRLSAALIQKLDEGDRLPVLPLRNPNLGPGSYNVSASTLSTGGPSFASSPHPSILSRESCQLTFNKDRKQYKPLLRQALLAQRKLQLQEKIKAAQANKKQRVLDTHNYFVLKLMNKDKQFERNRCRKELKGLRRSWGALVLTLGWACVAHNEAVLKSRLRVRSKVLLTVVWAVARVAGKLRRIGITKKVQRAMYLMQRIRIPVRRWLSNRNQVNQHILGDVLDRVASQDILVTLMAQWQSCLRLLQRNLRHLLNRKRLLFCVKKLLWLKVESCRVKSPVKRRTRRLSRFTPIPDKVRDVILRQHLKERTLKYLNDYRVYVFECKKLSYKASKYPRRQDPAQFGLIKPQCQICFTSEDYKAFITEALMLRSRWELMIEKTALLYDAKRRMSGTQIRIGSFKL